MAGQLSGGRTGRTVGKRRIVEELIDPDSSSGNFNTSGGSTASHRDA